MKKIITVILLSILLHFPFSCDFSSYERYEYEATSIDVVVGELDDQQVVSRDFTPPLSDTLSISEFAIQLEITEYTSKKVSFNRGLINPCFADPVPPSVEIEQILITSDQPMTVEGEVHEAHTLLNSVFEASDSYGEKGSLENFLSCCGYWYFNDPLFLTISKSIEVPLNQKFLIKVVLTNEQVFELETENVIVKP